MVRIPISERSGASAEEECAEERDGPPEREDPPERADLPERADPPQREPESQQDVDDITRGDPFQNMTEEELAAWRRAEDRFLGSGYGDQVFDSDEDL
jgi:hypothetical protein